MMQQTLRLLVAILAMTCVSVAQANPAHVLVLAQEQGQGLLFKRFNSCYLLTAGHVVGSGELVSVVGPGSKPLLGQAELVAKFVRQDLALLRTSGPIIQDCNTEISELAPSLDSMLTHQGDALLSYVYQTGGMSRTLLAVVDINFEFIRLKPQKSGDSIGQGQSGSLVRVADRPAGILLSVDSRDGIGKALRLDAAFKLIEGFFKDPSIATLPAKANISNVAKVSAKPGNLLSIQDGAQVVAWNTKPRQPEAGVNNLLIGVTNTPWVGELGVAGYVDIDFRLNKGQIHTVSSIEIEQSTVEVPGVRAKDIEVFVGNNGSSWNSRGLATVLATESNKLISFAPVRGGFIRIRIHSNWGDKRWVSLGTVAAY